MVETFFLICAGVIALSITIGVVAGVALFVKDIDIAAIKARADKHNRYSVEHNCIEEFVMNTYEVD